jgi:cob(I)alamin adenosyltransferase
MIGFEDLHNGEIPVIFIKYINRLSDYFFTLARFLSFKNNEPEIAWIPQKS